MNFGSMNSILDIEAFTKGINKTVMSTGLIIPVALGQYGVAMLSPLAPGMYGNMVVQAIGQILNYNIMSSH
jgi:hypothetical protein